MQLDIEESLTTKFPGLKANLRTITGVKVQKSTSGLEELREVVVTDAEKLIAVYPYRDADSSKVIEATQDLVLMVSGVPGIDDGTLAMAERVAI